MLAATVGTGAAGFRGCGIYPYNPQATPQHAYAIADNATVQANDGHQVEAVAVSQFNNCSTWLKQKLEAIHGSTLL